jgi:hypothetical protein
MANQKLQIDIIARDKSKQALGMVQKSLGRLRQSVFNLQNAFIGLGAGLVIRNLVNTGKNLENLRTRLKFLLKDTNEGAKAFDNMTKFASKVPFSLEEIQSGAGILATVTDNADGLQKMLEITGNVAATTGLDFRTAAEQIQRSFSAGIGAADLFREKGVRNMLGFKAGATVSIEDTVAAFERVFGRGGRFGKSTDELARTFEGTLSMIGDKIFNFKKVLLEAGFFEELKKQFGSLDKFLEDNAKELDKIAVAVGQNLAKGMTKVVQVGKDLIPTIQKIGSGLKSIIDGFMRLPPFVKEIGVIGAVLFGKKGVVALAGISFLIDKISDFINDTKTSLGIFDVNNISSVEARIKEINKQLENFSKIQQETVTVAGGKIELTKEELGINEDLKKALEKELNDLKIKLDLLKQTKELNAGNLPILRDQFKIYEGIAKEKEKVVQLTAREKGIIENQNKELTGFGHTVRKLNKESLKELQDKFKNIEKTIAEGINGGITKMSQVLAKSVVFGEKILGSFKDMARTLLANVLSVLIEIVARKGVELALEKLITREKQKQAALSGASFFSSFSGAFGMRASGGAVSKGKPYIVGEQGAELFVPNQSGQIQQAARGTNGGQTTVNFNINTLDASGFDELLIRNRGTITSIINSAVNERGSKNLI